MLRFDKLTLMLGRLGVHIAALLQEMETSIIRLPKVSGVSQQYLAPATNKLLEASCNHAVAVSIDRQGATFLN